MLPVSLDAALTLRGLTLANRIVMAPMTREFSPGGIPGADVAAYYARRARGGVGLIVTEGVGVPHPVAVDSARKPVLDASSLAGWKAVFDAVHAQGGRIAPQLWHQGVLREPANAQRPELMAVRPSGIWGPAGGRVSLDPDYVAGALAPTRPMTDSEIGDVIAAYGRAAGLAAGIGADAIAIHGAHGYLIDSFLWHETNRRQDCWAIGPEGRAAFGVAVVRAIRAAIGPDLPIMFRFSQFKMQDYNARLAETPDELGRLLRPLADASVDVFDGSQRYFNTPVFAGSTLNLAGWARRLTGRAAMTVGGVGLDQGRGGLHIDASARGADNLAMAAARLEAGEFDLIGVGRSLLNDADWLMRIRDGRPALPFDPAKLAVLD